MILHLMSKFTTSIKRKDFFQATLPGGPSEFNPHFSRASIKRTIKIFPNLCINVIIIDLVRLLFATSAKKNLGEIKLCLSAI